MSKEIGRTMFLENLPRKQGKLSKIDWLKCKNKVVKFQYDNIVGNIKIVNVIRENNRTVLLIKYKNIQERINTDNFQKCKIGKILKISYDSVRNHLKRGSKIWSWINYNAKEESLKVIRKNHRKSSIYKTI